MQERSYLTTDHCPSHVKLRALARCNEFAEMCVSYHMVKGLFLC
jgi:hypothetical protein